MNQCAEILSQIDQLKKKRDSLTELSRSSFDITEKARYLVLVSRLEMRIEYLRLYFNNLNLI